MAEKTRPVFLSRRSSTGSEVMTVLLPCCVSVSKIAATVKVSP